MKIQKQLEKLRSYYQKYGDLPTYGEMTQLFGYKSKSTAYYCVNKLIKTNFLAKKNGKLIPCKNFAGVPYMTKKQTDNRISLDHYLIDKPNSTILIDVEGNSMTGAGIFNKDIVIVQRALKASIGQTVVVNLKGEFTVKKLAKKGNHYVLESANSNYPDILLNRFTPLVGIVTGVIRKY